MYYFCSGVCLAFCDFITELDFNTDIDLITEFWRFQ